MNGLKDCHLTILGLSFLTCKIRRARYDILWSSAVQQNFLQ